MSVTSGQAISLLENVLFESQTQAKANAAGWVTLSNLNSAYSTVAGLAAAMAGTAEASIAQQVVRYYEGALGRAPGGTEIAYYVNVAETNQNGAFGAALTSSQIAQGASAVSQATWNQIAADFANSPEFSFASASASSVVTLLYLNILGRSPSATEVAYYNAQQAAGLGTSTLVQEFVNSPEYTNKVSSSIATNLGTFGTSVTNGTTPATIGPIQSTSPTTSFTLTTGQDTATANNFAAINASSGAGTTATLNAFDNLTGTAGGTNTLTVNSDGSAFASGITLSNIQTITINSTGDQSLTAVSESNWTGVTAININQISGVSAPANAAGSASATVSVNVPTTASLTDGGIIVGESQTTAPAEFTGLSINGGTSITASATASDANSTVASATILGDITVGGSTAPTGAITLTATETLATATSAPGNITVQGGTNVTVTSTVNSGVALGTVANGATTALSTAANIIVGSSTAPTGTVTVNSTTNSTNKTGVTIDADSIAVTGGTTVNVTETATETQSATVVSTINEGAVSVTGGTATTTVTVTQAAAATGAIAATAAAAVSGVTAVAAVTASPGVDAVAAVNGVNGGNSVSAITAAAGTPTVTDAAVTIADATNTATSTSTIKSVTLNNYGNSTFAGAALANLALSGTAGTLSITNGAAAAASNTTLALAVNNLSTIAGTNLITDTNNEITTLNVTTGATASTLTGFKDTGLTTLNVSGNSVLTLGTGLTTANDSALTKIVVSGSAGLTADVHSFGSSLAVTTTSSGTMFLTLDDTTQTFTGSTGSDIISLAGNASKAITAGSNATNEVILTAASGTYTAAGFGKYVTGFQILGVNDATATDANTYDLHGIFTGFKSIDLQSSMTAAQTFNGVASGTFLFIDSAQTNTISYVLYTASSTASVTTTLNTSVATAGITVNNLTLNDINNDGVATATFLSNAKTSVFTNASSAAQTNHITTLTDTGLTAINISGNAALDIGTISLGQPGQATPVGVASFTITDTSTGFDNTGSVHVASTIGSTSFTDDTLGSLTFAGSNNVTMANVVDNNAVNLTVTNSGTGAATITLLSTDANGAHAQANGLSNVTFSGSGAISIGTIQYGAATGTNTAALTFTNSGTGSVSIGALDYNGSTNTLGTSTTSLTLAGNIKLGLDATTLAADLAANAGVTMSATSGVTVAAGTDNSHINLVLTGAAAGSTDTVTLGNGNNVLVENTAVSSTVSITVGTGSNYIDVSHNTAAGSYSVTLGAHTSSGPDEILTSEIGTTAAATAINTTITGAVTGDLVKIADANVITLNTVTAAQQSTFAADAATSLSSAVTYAHTLTTGGHAGVVFTYAGNTYLIEDVAATTAAATSTVIELVGVHTLTASSTAGVLNVAS